MADRENEDNWVISRAIAPGLENSSWGEEVLKGDPTNVLSSIDALGDGQEASESREERVAESPSDPDFEPETSVAVAPVAAPAPVAVPDAPPLTLRNTQITLNKLAAASDDLDSLESRIAALEAKASLVVTQKAAPAPARTRTGERPTEIAVPVVLAPTRTVTDERVAEAFFSSTASAPVRDESTEENVVPSSFGFAGAAAQKLWLTLAQPKFQSDILRLTQKQDAKDDGALSPEAVLAASKKKQLVRGLLALAVPLLAVAAMLLVLARTTNPAAPAAGPAPSAAASVEQRAHIGGSGQAGNEAPAELAPAEH